MTGRMGFFAAALDDEPPVSVFDDFNRADENPVAGYDFTTGSGEFFEVVGNRLEAVGTNIVAVYDQTLTSDAMWAEVTVRGSSGTSSWREFGAGVRFQNTGASDGYIVHARPITSTDGELTRVSINSTNTSGGRVEKDHVIVADVTDKSIGISCDGTTIKAFVDGVEVLSLTDGAIAANAGRRRIGVWSYAPADTNYLDDFQGGEGAYGGGPAAPPPPSTDKQVLLIGGNASINGFDSSLQSIIEAWTAEDFVVTYARDNISPATVDAYDLLVISDTATSGADDLTSRPTPTLMLSRSLAASASADERYVASSSGTGADEVRVRATTHPILTSLGWTTSNQLKDFYLNGLNNYSFAADSSIAAGVDLIAQEFNSTGIVAQALETGDDDYNTDPVAGPRVWMLTRNEVYGEMTSDGKAFLESCAAWLVTQ